MSREPASSGHVQSRKACSFQSVFPTLILYSNPQICIGEYLLPFLEDEKGGIPPLQRFSALIICQITGGAFLTSYSWMPHRETGSAERSMTDSEAGQAGCLGLGIREPLAKGPTKNTEGSRRRKGISRGNKKPMSGGPQRPGFGSRLCHLLCDLPQII